MNKIMLVLFTSFIVVFCNNFAFALNGDLTISNNLNVRNQINFLDQSTQTTSAAYIVSSGSATPNTYFFNIPITVPIPPSMARLRLDYTIITTVDPESIMMGFNDNTTAGGWYQLYAITGGPATSGTVQAGYGRTAAGSNGQYNSYDIVTSGNYIFVKGDHISDSNWCDWPAIFRGYLKYPTTQTLSGITKINIKCFHPSTNILSINWKLVAIPY